MSTLAVTFSVYDVLHRVTYTLAIGLVQDDLPNLLSTKEHYLPLVDHTLLHTYYEKRQRDFLLGRKALHIALSSMQKNLNQCPHELQYGVLGQPLLKNNTFLDISISHSASIGLAVVFPRELLFGIDLEQLENPAASQVALEPSERELFESAQLNASVYPTLAWTIKESLGKSIKCGLNLSSDAAAIDSIKRENEPTCPLLRSTFKKFYCFTCYSFVFDSFIISFTLPKHLVLSDSSALSRSFCSFFSHSPLGAYAT